MTDVIQDQEQRQQALDSQQSFIVQAPAGSGKTELLTQRFLVLLSQVKQPEEILAITFTRKSAAEMRSRILNALKQAQNDPRPTITHAKKTWDLAHHVLKRNQALQWDLLENPNRLRIQTMDAFNAYLTKQLPILANFGATPEIIDDPSALYQAAVQEFLSHLEENLAWSDAIATLLVHLDNDLTKVETLLINLLAKRDQWLPYITMNTQQPMLRQRLEMHLTHVVVDILASVCSAFPEDQIGELLFLADFAAQNLKRENSDSLITCCTNLSILPGKKPTDKNLWLGLSELLLTKEFNWRKNIDKNLGFPSPSNIKNATEKASLHAIKQRLKNLIESLSPHENLRSALEELRSSPECYYQDAQWETLEALHPILCIVVAQLKLVFQQHTKIDYIENAQAALVALGTEELPTDMSLALDYQIQHILVDEFQDTSNSQYRLLEKLTAGWEKDDGRTLFVVGDPMQSIYRFREAEVGLFIRARQHGLGQIKLVPLTLSVNFRSTQGIVNWVNAHFQHVLPKFEDIATGAVSYSPSIAHHLTTDDHPAVQLHAFTGEEKIATAHQQAKAIADVIHKIKLANPTETIAILIRSRNHLKYIIPALKAANLAYRAIDIDPLDTRPIIQDLMALLRALLNPADRVAWLATLRAPWCGLTLSDLLILSGNHSNVTLLERLTSPEVIKQLSLDAQTRLTRLLPILQAKTHDRYRFGLRTWLESAWLLLGGPACVTQINDLEDATAFFNLLEKLENSHSILNIDELQTQVKRLFASANNETDTTLQIMTVHNAKGLEFDTVILPHLERRLPNDDKELLLWMERPLQDESSALLLAPIHAIGEENERIYSYIRRQQRQKNDHEIGRLLYVAATRAKKQLHLFFQIGNEGKLNSNSLLEKLWKTLQHEIMPQATSSPLVSPLVEKEKTFIHRLVAHWQNPLSEKTITDEITYHRKKSGFSLPENHSRLTGILTHQILQQICQFNCDFWQTRTQTEKTSYVKNHFLQLGLLTKDLPLAIETVLTAINNTLSDARGQWIIQPHQEAKNELQLTAVIAGKIKSLIIDRTFVDEEGRRWIIDYKTASFSGDNREKFLNDEKKKYALQLEEYAKAIAFIDARPIRLGLYFPVFAGWIEW